MGNNSSNGILLGALLLLSIIAVNIKNQLKFPTPVVEPQAVLNIAETNGIKYSGTMANLRKDIQKLQDDGVLSLTIRPGKLSNPILGQTNIAINDAEGKIDCIIIIDIEDAFKGGDNIEPLLGHEFKHVWDALFLYDKTDPYTSTAKFIEAANIGKKTLYRDREVESSAIGIENIIRKELKASKNSLYVYLPISREAADVMFENRSKSDPTIRPSR